MQRVISEIVKRFLILWVPFFLAAPAFGQEPENKELMPPEEPSPSQEESPAPVNQAQNAVLEGIQLSSEPGKEAGEIMITCYFIFRDKPSSYFYEVKKKTSKLVFEFHDTQKGASPIASQKLSPIEGFVVEQKKLDANREVKGLNPEWHDMITVTFDLTLIPQINVTDEYNVISYTFKWSSDPAQARKYVLQEGKTNWGLVGGLVGGGAVLAGVGLWYFLKPVPTPAENPLDTNDLPSHQPRMFGY
jgi:hypothetical protein